MRRLVPSMPVSSSVAGGLLGVAAMLAALALACPAFATLPDNRAYELVSPVEKGGDSVLHNMAIVSADGEHAIVDGGVDNALLSNVASWMLETRTPTGWTGVQIGPAPTPNASYAEQRAVGLDLVAEDFSSFAFQTMLPLSERDRPSAAGGPSSDVYVRDSPSGQFTWASGPPSPMAKVAELSTTGECAVGPFGRGLGECGENNAYLAGASSDLSTVVWSQELPLLAPPAALAGYPPDTHEHGGEVYASFDGADQELVGLVPASGAECGPSSGGCVVPPCGAAMGNFSGEVQPHGFPVENAFAPTQGAVSGDGSQVVFTSPAPSTEGTPGCVSSEVYLREDGTRTVEVSASQRAGGDPNGPRRKLYAGTAEEDGHISTVFFTSPEELTEDSNTGSKDQGNDLYAYSVKTGELTDITPDGNPADANGASVVSFIGSSTNGQIVYFTADGVLTGKPNSLGETAQPGVSNLYVYDHENNTTTFIAPGGGVEGPSTGEHLTSKVSITSQVTPDGRHLVFVSKESLTSYDQDGYGEVYLYDEATNDLACVSCDTSGTPPSGSAFLAEEEPEGSLDFEEPHTLPHPLVISDDGNRVFFSSPDQLTPEAPAPTPIGPGEYHYFAKNAFTEPEPDAYEYENGHVYLIAPDAVILASTPTGNDVFFDTLAQLVPQDRDGSPDVYDARVDGGFPALASPECSGTACQGAPAPAPIFATPPSVTFDGVGNFPPPAPTVKPQKKKASKQPGKKNRSKKKTRKKKREKKHTGKRASRKSSVAPSSTGRANGSAAPIERGGRS